MLSDPIFIPPAMELPSVEELPLPQEGRVSPERDICGPFAFSAFLAQEQQTGEPFIQADSNCVAWKAGTMDIADSYLSLSGD